MRSASALVGRPSSGGAARRLAGSVAVHLRELGDPLNRPPIDDWCLISSAATAGGVFEVEWTPTLL